jgi:poly-gamma-glutamate synthesis protein (capsule biosynthesis protein)
MTFNPECMAGEQTASLPGRPGVNGIRVTKKFRVPKEELAHLKRIADALSLNASADIIRAEGYLPQLKEGEQPFAQMMFEAADKAEVVATINPVDMKRITDAIAEARFMADYVVISMHNHLVEGKCKEAVDAVSTEFSHLCIDAGADAIIGTGPHLLRAMEIYKGKPVFYCLGDFINQLETILRAPDGMFAKQKLNGNDRLDVLFNDRSANGTRGLSYSKVMFESVVPYWEVENGELRKLLLLPVEEHFALPRSRNGWPKKDTASNIIERFAEMSKPWGVDIKIENGLGVVEL